MSRLDSPEPVVVELGPCECTGQPHEADLVYLAPTLSMSGGMAAQGAIQQAGTDPVRLQELLADIWVRHGVTGWNLLDDKGNAIPLTADNIARALPYGKGGRLVAERADDLYAEDILAPLVQRLETLSQRGSTPSGPRRTSRTRTSTTKPRSRS
jgi:hypothetical protein